MVAPLDPAVLETLPRVIGEVMSGSDTTRPLDQGIRATFMLDISGPLQLDASILYWPSPVITVLGTWVSTNTTCGYLVEVIASEDLNAELGVRFRRVRYVSRNPVRSKLGYRNVARVGERRHSEPYASRPKAATMTEDENARVRRFFETREAALGLCAGFCELLPFGDESEDVAHVARHWRFELVKTAIDITFKHAASPIERYFLGSLVLTYIMRQPLGYKFTSPSHDVRADITDMRSTLTMMRDVDAKLGAKTGSMQGFWSVAPDEDWRSRYLGYLGLGVSEAVHFTPQAGFPKIRIKGTSVRVDLLAWVPDDPEFMLAIECDGYEWHSSRDRFANDRARDRALKANGVDVLRIAGTEIHNDLARVSHEIFDYVETKRSGGVLAHSDNSNDD